jgi:hypothetical protein
VKRAGFSDSSAKAERTGDCSPPAKAGGNMQNRDIGALAIQDAVVINGFTDAAIKCWPNPESIPDYVLSSASVIFGSGNVQGTNI